MVSKLLLAAAAATAVLASPVPEPVLLQARQGVSSCRNQSCLVATVSGSTGATVYPYRDYPVGDTADGDCCIVRYFPAAKDAIYANRLGLQSYCASHGGDAPLDSNPPGVDKVSLAYPPPSPPPSAGQPAFPAVGFINPFASINPPFTAACKSKILIYVKGTFETGEFGNLLGQDLVNALGSEWLAVGVQYNNGLDQNYCLGLPGGKTAREVFAGVYAKCPNSIYAIAGYSQGAMAVRHALARLPAAAVARVKSMVTFGDPFNGAEVGQYKGPRHVYCNADDGVCSGQLNITPGHLGYSPFVGGAATLIKADTA